jgi:UMF1 family MFS transporter
MASRGRLKIAAWILYGAGSSGYVMMVPTIGYAAYFHSQVAGNDPQAASLWAVAVAGALIVTGLTAPFLGALADSSGHSRSLLMLLTVISCTLTASLASIGPGDVLAGILLFIGAHAAFLLAKALYDSYLPGLGTASAIPIISSLGWALGYAGSIVCFLLCLPFVQAGEGRAPETFRLTFLVTAIFFAFLSLPSILLLGPANTDGASRDTRRAFDRVLETIGRWREHREVWKFLFAFYLINDAIVTVVFFIGIFFKTTYGLSIEHILWLTLLFYAVGIPSTIAFGYLGRTWSERGALYITLLVWLLLLATMALGEGPNMPIVIALMAGLVVGSSQALCRSMYAQMIPPDRASEFFGFNALVGRASAALGPLTFGLVVAVSGSQRMAMASLAAFIISGAIMLTFHKPGNRPSDIPKRRLA